MNKLLSIILLIPTLAFSQEKEVLRYFISKDSLIGVKNQAGKIIIPAEFRDYTGIKDGELVKEGMGNETILFFGGKRNEESEKNSFGSVYDKKGKFLYSPFFFDNGADYFSEGVRRLVKNGKVGFADRNGTIVIQPKHDFVSSFNYGHAVFCDGCDWEKTEDEHKSIVGGIWGVMNRKGETVQPLTKYSDKDLDLDGKYYSYPFQYSEKEKNILQFFEKYNKIISAVHYVNVYNEMSADEKKLLFEIVERPQENFPYYQVNTYDNKKTNLAAFDDLKFFVSEDGKRVFTINYEDKMIPFEKWLKEEIKQAEEYQKKHSNNPNKFKNNQN
ncbi:WG repeat-containing protein [Chryseobacterium sp. c4a]|uniref:WG repeat-containing protein n=1 Tax=Chryseobacterium sp. c4a TaxID=1573582 RepID=UPI00135B85E2|nr:WG repeat-containing protein [Chryseobacterium sp. c4a]